MSNNKHRSSLLLLMLAIYRTRRLLVVEMLKAHKLRSLPALVAGKGSTARTRVDDGHQHMIAYVVRRNCLETHVAAICKFVFRGH